MKKTINLLFWGFTLLCILGACSDNDSFTTSSSNLLTFSTDTVKLDTVFSNVPSATRSFWVYNNSGDGLKLKRVRLSKGGSTGYRVNVDGVYLAEAANYAATDLEVRNKDSIRVFVELTSPTNGVEGPQLLEDKLVFMLESGVEQQVDLQAYSWDATLLRNVHITRDSTLATGTRPYVIYGGVTVDEGATLRLGAGSTFYFHNDAGMNVYGTLQSQGTADSPVTLRGDRIDRMFDYLPYDYVPGQWQGIHFYGASYDNELLYTDIHSGYNGVIADSSDVTRLKLTVENSTIHNCQGYGLYAVNSRVAVRNTQITNTLNDCVRFDGGDITANNCTWAQFYAFDSNRGAALHFTARQPLVNFTVLNSLITGYADDVMMGEPGNDATVFNYAFDHCIIRTPKITTADSTHFTAVIYENVKDTVSSGEKHFVRIDPEMLRYDFHLREGSSAIGKADSSTSLPTDHDGMKRDDNPDLGAYEYRKQEP
jgi:hypothetical protein